MKVTIDIPNQIYQKIEQIVTQKIEPTSWLVEKYINDTIKSAFETLLPNQNPVMVVQRIVPQEKAQLSTYLPMSKYDSY